MMAPARETSKNAHMPLEPSTPVRIIADVFDYLRNPSENTDLAPIPIAGPSLSAPRDEAHPPFLVPVALQNAFIRLSQSSAAYLVSNSPVRSGHPLPSINPITISPMKPRYTDLFSVDAATERERIMEIALRDAEIKEAYLKKQLRGQQAATVTQQIYCKRVHHQLATKEEKQGKKGKGKGRLVADGNPRILTDNKFVDLVIAHEEATRTAEEEKKTRRIEKVAQGDLMKQWQIGEVERKRKNEEIGRVWEEKKVKWNEEFARAKAEGRTPPAKSTKPLRGPLLSAAPKPKTPRRGLDFVVEADAEEVEHAREESSESGEEIVLPSFTDEVESEDDDD